MQLMPARVRLCGKPLFLLAPLSLCHARRSYNPCVKDTYCDGHSEECPTDEYEPQGTHCAWSG